MPLLSTARCFFLLKTLVILALAAPGTLFSQPLQTVKDFGAAGDGEQDDTAAIQKAVDAKIGEIYLPRGRYRITQPIVIDLNEVGPASVIADGGATLVMEGGGPALKWVGSHDGTANPRTVNDAVRQRQRKPTIQGVEIVGKHPEAMGISLEGTMQAIVSQVLIRHTKHGIVMSGRNRNIIISDSHIYENYGIGISMDRLNLHQINITNCHISYNRQGGIIIRRSEIRNLQIGLCDIEANMSPDTPSAANILIDTSEGSVREGSIVGCSIQHDNEPANSANIRFIGRSAETPYKVGMFSIADNMLSDVDTNIHLQNARGVVITGNILWQGYEHNLRVENSSNIVLGPNLLDRNPDYGREASNSVLFQNSSDCTIQGVHLTNTLNSAAGMIFKQCRRFNITGCTIVECETGGILLDEGERFQISNSLIEHSQQDSYSAIKAAGGRNNRITHNLIGGSIDAASTSAQLSGNSFIKK